MLQPSPDSSVAQQPSSARGGAWAEANRESRTLPQLFEEQAQRSPNSIAVSSRDTSLTYEALDRRSNQLAHALLASGVHGNPLVGLCVDRSPDLLVAILGILKAGAAYVPIDPAYPQERVSFMLADAGIQVLLTDTVAGKNLAGFSGRTIFLDRERATLDERDPRPPAVARQPTDLAYVIYTSGSTGKPKGALITHENVVRLFRSTEPWFGFGPEDVWTLFHSSAFDFSVWEIWGALLYGGRLVVVPFEITRTPAAFHQLLADEKITVLNQTPSAFRQLIRAEEAVALAPALALRYVIFGGEALDMKSLEPWFRRHGDAQPKLVNMYGITETTVHVTYRPLRQADLSKPSVIGKPIPDLTLHLLDDDLQPVETGMSGEICVGGAGLGRGYLNRPELTAQKFVQWHGKRLYRSGDLGRYLPDGDLEYLGRKDLQVKIRGFRIELGEIESAINAHPSVRESVVLARDAESGEKRLVAYVILQPNTAPDFRALRQLVRVRLPEYMVPAAFVAIAQLPLTTNGKLDVASLPNPAGDEGPGLASVATPAAPPQSQTEKTIAHIWGQVLKLPRVSREDNFFDVGGNSLSLAEVHVQLQKATETDFPITRLFEFPTVAKLAEFLAGTKTSNVSEEARLRAQRQREALQARKIPRRP